MLKKFFHILLWALVIVWLVVIFNFSASDGATSDGQSKGFIERSVYDVATFLYNIGIRDHAPSERNVKTVANRLNATIRKIAHGTIYFVLAFLVLIALGTKIDHFWRNSLIAVLFCLIYSLTDEYHQLFVPGRTGAFTDCLIDTGGALIACVVYGIGVWIVYLIKSKKK